MPTLEAELPVSHERESDVVPAWIAAMMPDQRQEEIRDKIAHLQAEAEQLQHQARQMEPMGRLVWQAGQPLREAVGQAFAAAGFEVHPAPPDTPYDVVVELGEGKRLLVIVTGPTGPVTKTATVMRRAFEAVQTNAGKEDTVIIAANAYRNRPPGERPSLIDDHGCMVLTGLGVVAVSTISLFQVWCVGRDDPAGARQFLQELHQASPGLVVFDAEDQPIPAPAPNEVSTPTASPTRLQRFFRL